MGLGDKANDNARDSSKALNFTKLADFHSPRSLDPALDPKTALSGSRILGIGAHADDLEFMCLSAIEKAVKDSKTSFCGIVLSDGRGSARGPAFAHLRPEEFAELRRSEQKKAADLSHFRGVFQFSFQSSEFQHGLNPALLQNLVEIFSHSHAEEVYTHNPFDRHPTHRAVLHHVLAALAKIPKGRRPKKVIGCEVWRSLDWLPDSLKIVLPVRSSESAIRQLYQVYASQIQESKDYAAAVIGRKKSNATFQSSHSVDHLPFAEFGVDLSPIVQGKVELKSWVKNALGAFEAQLKSEIWGISKGKHGSHSAKKSRSRIRARRKNHRKTSAKKT